jgi:hypothetical protein
LKFLPTHFLLPILGATLFAACSPAAPEISKVPVPAGAPVSRAFGIWTPNTASGDTCSKEIHDQYWTYGPDGKVYPSWHPAVDASGCTFGHEHGRNPKDSKLISLTLPFGYVNEQLSPSDPQYQRNEDHVGHKVEWANDIEISRDNRPYTKCDVLFKLHQGTHSPDALTNNLHELFYYASCGDGTKMQWRNLQAFGHGGKVRANGCKDDKKGINIPDADVAVGTPVPATSPDGGGERRMPASSCVEAETLVAKGDWSNGGTLRENWVVSVGGSAKHDPKKEAMSFFAGPYFQVNNPSRYFDPTSANKVSRPIDLCLKRGDLEWRGDKTCDSVRTQTPTGLMAYTDPNSPFNGADREVHMNGLHINNAGGPTKWYSDVFGKQLQTKPDVSKGIILEQFIGSVDNTPEGKDFRGPVLRGDYDHDGVHAPN